MYIPNINRLTDRPQIVAFMRRFSFATVVTSAEDMPAATHIPVIVREEEGELALYGHVARQNEQWKQITEKPVLVIFSEPHAYISPANYEKELNVPTWNYIAVHAYGKGELITEYVDVIALLEITMDNYEPAYRAQWERLPEKYKSGLVQGIVAFKIAVTELQAKEKLSQNKTRGEQQKIIDTLSGSADTAESTIAAYMAERLARGSSDA